MDDGYRYRIGTQKWGESGDENGNSQVKISKDAKGSCARPNAPRGFIAALAGLFWLEEADDCLQKGQPGRGVCFFYTELWVFCVVPESCAVSQRGTLRSVKRKGGMTEGAGVFCVAKKNL